MKISIIISVKLFVAILLILLITLGALPQTPQPPHRTAKTDIVAIVGNRYLLRNELKRKVDKLLAKDTAQSSNEDDEIAFRNFTEGKVVEEWVNTTLLALAAEKQGLKVSAEELQQKLEQLQADYAPNLNVEIALERAGYTRDEFLQEMRDALLGEKLLRDHINKLYTEKQLREIYNQNSALFIKPPQAQVQHIVYILKGTETKEEKKQIYNEMNALRQRALNGEDFEKLVSASQTDSRYHYSNLGWLPPTNRLPEPINGLIFELKPGQVSKVTLDKKELGYHLVKVLAKKRASGLTFEEARPDVEAFLFAQEKERLLEQLKRQFRVVINLSGIPESIAFPDKVKY